MDGGIFGIGLADVVFVVCSIEHCSVVHCSVNDVVSRSIRFSLAMGSGWVGVERRVVSAADRVGGSGIASGVWSLGRAGRDIQTGSGDVGVVGAIDCVNKLHICIGSGQNLIRVVQRGVWGGLVVVVGASRQGERVGRISGANIGGDSNAVVGHGRCSLINLSTKSTVNFDSSYEKQFREKLKGGLSTCSNSKL